MIACLYMLLNFNHPLTHQTLRFTRNVTINRLTCKYDPTWEMKKKSVRHAIYRILLAFKIY